MARIVCIGFGVLGSAVSYFHHSSIGPGAIILLSVSVAFVLIGIIVNKLD